MRRFGTQGRVYPDKHYVVPRTEEIADFINRVKEGRYVVLFAPRQTGKTTFFRLALETLTTQETTYFPIQLDFQIVRNTKPATFYERLYYMIQREIEAVFQKQGKRPSAALIQLLEETQLTDEFSMIMFFQQLSSFIPDKRVVIVIDEFDGTPQTVVSEFLYALRHIYLSDEPRCPYSVGIIGVKSINQLNYDHSVSPFNIQDEFNLPNFTLEQVQELFRQYTDETSQTVAPDVVKAIHKQTAGQPVLVNRFGQILTEEMDIPKTEMIAISHFTEAHARLLEENNVNITQLTTNIRKDPRFETFLMKIVSYNTGIRFALRNEIISELATYGVIVKGTDGMCEILNPIYHYCIIDTFKPLVNGLENQYLPTENTIGFQDYLTSVGDVDMVKLLDNFRGFIARAGFRVLQVPDTPREFIGQHLLMAYLDQFVQLVGGTVYVEVPTGRGRMDLVICYHGKKYIVETKIWEGDSLYQAGKRQLAAYLKLEGILEGYYVVFDHRQTPEPRVETETLDEVSIRSYIIPVVQEVPSDTRNQNAENVLKN